MQSIAYRIELHAQQLIIIQTHTLQAQVHLPTCTV